jgi:hypothetical protein
MEHLSDGGRRPARRTPALRPRSRRTFRIQRLCDPCEPSSSIVKVKDSAHRLGFGGVNLVEDVRSLPSGENLDVAITESPATSGMPSHGLAVHRVGKVGSRRTPSRM